MNDKFKYYTEKGFEFEIFQTILDPLRIAVVTFEDWEMKEVYAGDNLDHAFAACDLWLLGDGQ